MSEEKVAWRPVLRRPGRFFSISPATVAALRKVRFITAFSPSQPSRPSRRPSGVEEGGGVGDLVEAPDQQRVVVGDEAERVEAGGLHAAGDEEAEGLVGVAAGEAVEAEVRAAAPRGKVSTSSRPGSGRRLTSAWRASQSCM